MEMLPHRPPFLLVDKIIELSDQHVVGVKNVTMNEDFFQGHFPGAPVMPGFTNRSHGSGRRSLNFKHSS